MSSKKTTDRTAPQETESGGTAPTESAPAAPGGISIPGESIITQQIADTKSAFGELFESGAQLGSYAINEISQVAHVLDNEFLTAFIPIKLPTGHIVNFRLRLSVLRLMGLISVAAWVYMASPWNPENPTVQAGKPAWNFPALAGMMQTIDQLATMSEAMLSGVTALATSTQPAMEGAAAAAAGAANTAGDLGKGGILMGLLGGLGGQTGDIQIGLSKLIDMLGLSK